MAGKMLVRVYRNGDTEGKITRWNDGWRIAMAMTDWLSGTEWFEILGYYPDDEAVSNKVVEENFLAAEERHAAWSSE